MLALFAILSCRSTYGCALSACSCRQNVPIQLRKKVTLFRLTVAKVTEPRVELAATHEQYYGPVQTPRYRPVAASTAAWLAELQGADLQTVGSRD